MSSFALCLQQCWWIAQGSFACDKHNCVFPGDRKQEGYIGMCAQQFSKLVDEVQALFYGCWCAGVSLCSGLCVTSGGEI